METFIEKANPAKFRAKIPVETIGRSKGLPSGQVHDFVKDKQGVFWLAGPNGLLRYDGSRVRTFTKKDGLSTHGTRSVAVCAEGNIWVGSDAGLDIVSPDGTVQKPSQYWRYGFVECIESAPDGSMWIGTAEGLLTWSEKDGLQSVSDPLLQSGMIYALLLDSKGTLWVSAENSGLLCNSGDGWKRPAFKGWESIGTIRVLSEGAGAIYAGGDTGLVRYSEDYEKQINDPIDLDPVSAILETKDELWVGISGELRIYKEHGNLWFVDRVVLKNTLVNALKQDSIGNVWCATDTKGMMKISVLRKAIILPEQLQDCGIFSIRKTGERSFFIGGEHQSYKLSLENGTSIQPLPMLNGTKVWDMLEDSAGTIWAATQKGLFKKTLSGRFEAVKGDLQSLSSPGRVLHERGKDIWYGTLSGLIKIEDGGLMQIRGKRGHSFGYVYTIAEDRNGKLWIGTLGNGLWMESENECFSQIKNDALTATGNVYAIAPHGDGGLAIAQDEKIIFLSEDNDARILAETDQPVAAWALKWAGDKRLLAGSSIGLTEYDAENGEILRHVDTLMEPEDWEFTTSRSLCIDESNDTLLCGLSGGLAIIDQAKFDEFNSLPEIKIDSIRWSNAEVAQNGNRYIVQTGKWTMEADVHATWFIDEGSLKYRFRLVGFDDAWSKETTNAGVHYNSLPPGNYTLEAQAFTPLFGWGPVEKLAEVRVESPWWASGVFSLPYAAADAFMGIVESKRRNNELLERNLELESHVRERTREIEEANRNLQELNKKLKQISWLDSLTGISNRRHFDEVLDRELERARRSEAPISLILIDVDHFKSYNDKYGHQQGDKCLRAVALAMGMTLRESGDLIARYGGEEFAIILPYTSLEEAILAAERLRKTVESLKIPHAGSPTSDYVTVSLGVAAGNFNRHDNISDLKLAKDDLIEEADMSLYRAKALGRNRSGRQEEIFGLGASPLSPAFSNELVREIAKSRM